MALLTTPRAMGILFSRSRSKWLLLRLLLLAVLAGWLASSRAGAAQPTRASEYQVKAVCLFNFIQFVEWPQTGFKAPDDAIKIGVLGKDPFGEMLDAAVQGEKIRGRPLMIVRSDNPRDLRDCHLVFVSRSERGNVPSILSTFSGRPVLTVGDMPDFARQGGAINFYLEGQKVRFEVNRAVAQEHQLKVSSQLLSLARIVGPMVEGRGR